MKPPFSENRRQHLLKVSKFLGDAPAPWNALEPRLSSKPRYDGLDCMRRIAVMGMDILAGKIGNKSLIAVGFNIEDQRTFFALSLVAEALGSQEQAEFKWHVEAGQGRGAVNLGSGKVVNAEWTFLDKILNFGEAAFAAVVHLEGATRLKAGAMHGKNDGSENRLKMQIKGAIDKYVSCAPSHIIRQASALAAGGVRQALFEPSGESLHG